MKREAVTKALARRIGADADADARTVAQAFASTWQQIADPLEKVIGRRGVSVLLDRALHLAAKQHAWLLLPSDPAAEVGPLHGLIAALESQSVAEGTQASGLLFESFTELLDTLIGKSLTDRLLGAIWIAPTPASAKKDTYE
ncbi:hypothetical protein [Rhodoferax sp.]|uniref:hypothetical protein n=1 Tax=Rhodoferax sp. TaxID=50421 RepID=UPI00374CB6D0